MYENAVLFHYFRGVMLNLPTINMRKATLPTNFESNSNPRFFCEFTKLTNFISNLFRLDTCYSMKRITFLKSCFIAFKPF